MKKKLLWQMLVWVLLTAVLLSGCGNKNKVDLHDAYVLITKSAGNPYNTHMANGFREIIEGNGGRAVILEPEKATAEEQISMIQSCIGKGVKSIAIAANDPNALDSALQEAMDDGIQISTLDSNTNGLDRCVFVNQVSAQDLAQELMDAVYELAGGSGSWAILSTTNQATNQSEWIHAMQELMPQEKYQDLRLVSIAFGEDDAQLSKEKVEGLVSQYPDLKVICAPTVVGMRAAAEVLAGQDTSIKLTGLGLPSEMAPYMTGEDPLCPIMYLWNPISIGRLSAQVSMALNNGSITGTPGETLWTTGGEQYEIVESSHGGSEVIVGMPQKFTPDNISVWKDVF